MSSETKSRAGRTAEQVVNEWRDSGSRDWGQLVSAINYWAVTDMCPALESSSSAGTGGREALSECAEALDSIWAAIGDALCSGKGIEKAYANKVASQARIASDKARKALGRGADPGTTGAEGRCGQRFVGGGQCEKPLGHTGACVYSGSDGVFVPSSAMRWLMGEEGDFLRPHDSAGNFWWRSEFRKRIATATQRAPVTPPKGGIPKWLWEPFCDANGIPLKCSICGSDIPRIDNGWHGDAEGKVVQHIECSYQQQIKELQAKLATPAPVTTPGRDEFPHKACRQAEAALLDRISQLEQALAAAKEPRG